MSRTLAAFAALALLPGAAGHAGAQERSDVSAYLALVLTPVGALPPVATAPMLESVPERAAFHVRYGRYRFEGDDVTIHNIGVGPDMALGRGRLAVAAGLTLCGGCDGQVMLGAEYSLPLLRTRLGGGPAAVRSSASDSTRRSA